MNETGFLLSSLEVPSISPTFSIYQLLYPTKLFFLSLNLQLKDNLRVNRIQFPLHPSPHVIKSCMNYNIPARCTHNMLVLSLANCHFVLDYNLSAKQLETREMCGRKAPECRCRKMATTLLAQAANGK